MYRVLPYTRERQMRGKDTERPKKTRGNTETEGRGGLGMGGAWGGRKTRKIEREMKINKISQESREPKRQERARNTCIPKKEN